MPQLRTHIQAAFTPFFCYDLTLHLTVAFKNCDDKKYRWLWCGGIKIPDWCDQPFKNPSYVFTLAGFGELKRQHLYKVIIKLGKCSLVNCCEGSGLSSCLPDFDSLDWVTLDMEQKVLVLRLN